MRQASPNLTVFTKIKWFYNFQNIKSWHLCLLLFCSSESLFLLPFQSCPLLVWITTMQSVLFANTAKTRTRFWHFSSTTTLSAKKLVNDIGHNSHSGTQCSLPLCWMLHFICYYAECHYVNAIMLSVIMLNAVMLSVIMLNMVMLSAIAPF